MFSTKLIKQHPNKPARVMRVNTAHGEFQTPSFMPVATRAFMNVLSIDQLHECGCNIILGGNTYHMLASPGLERIENMGGMHELMGWDQPMLTDSGGFQIYSLSKDSKICKITDEGAQFTHPETRQKILLTPESSLQAQKVIGADIIMAFDQCTPDVDDRELVDDIMQRTHRWLLRSREYQSNNPNSAYGYSQALFGIIQGGFFEDLRIQSTEYVKSLDFDGIAIGGASIGFDMQKTSQILDWVEPLLPIDKIRYTMGVGLNPQDLIDVVAKGVDIFDCVAPTRNARHGSLYCGKLVKKDNWLEFECEPELDKPRLLIKRSIYAEDKRPIIEGCECYTCKNHTRGYLHYLFKSKAMIYYSLACIHNIYVMQQVCLAMQELILDEPIEIKG